MLTCNEAVSERTNGSMRRLLAPFRLKMGRDVLLSRLTIAKHAGAEPPRGGLIIRPPTLAAPS
jgi:hypothetical protein